MADVLPIPPGFETVTPHLTIKGAAAALDFYRRAFGAEELWRHEAPGGGPILNACIKIGTSPVMLNDEFPQGSPAPGDSSPVTIHLYVEDADAVYECAVAAGADVVMPIDNAFWGDRYGVVRDPFGHVWSIATHVEDVSPEDKEARAAQAFAAEGH